MKKMLPYLALLAFLTGCGEEKRIEELLPDAFIVTTDYQTGSYSLLKVEDATGWVSNSPNPIHSDAVARFHNGLIYIIERLGADCITVIDARNGKYFSPVTQFSVGAGTNPQDIAFVGDKAYISRMDSDKLLVVNSKNGEKTKEIPLSQFVSEDDADGLPEMGPMAVVGDSLFVTLEMLNREAWWTPVDNGVLVKIDTSRDDVLKSYRLNGKNPWSLSDSLRFYNGFLYIIEHGSSFDTKDGIVEKFDPSKEEFSTVVTEEELGGDISDIEILSDDTGYAVISDENWNTKVVRFNPATGKKIKEVYSPDGYSVADIEIMGNLLLVAYRPAKGDSGIILISTETDEVLTKKPIITPLPPFDIEVIR